MLPQTHLILGLILVLLIAFIFPQIGFIPLLLIFLSSVFIDIDHYIFFILKKKDWSLKKAYYWHKNLPRSHKPIMHLFHTTEFLVLTAILSFFFHLIFFILIGMLFHSFLDMIEMGYGNTLENREFFLTTYLLGSKKRYL